MMRSAPSPEDQIRSIHYKYDISEERVKAALEDHRFGEVDQASLLSCLCSTSMEEILAMRKDDPWGIVRKKLGFTAESYEEAYLRHRAERLHRSTEWKQKEPLHSSKKAIPATGSASLICSNSTAG